MKWRALAVILVCLVLAGTALAMPAAKAGKGPKWMELIYLDADNNLDVYAGAHHEPVVEDDFQELMSVGSSPDVAVYVLVDRWTGPANLFKVHKGWMEEIKRFSLNGKEANMGDPATLRSFVTFTMKAESPEQTVLMFWDHGSPQMIAYDENAGTEQGWDMLTHDEVLQALKGIHVDIIGADECLVGQLDVAYQYYANGLSTDYLLISETYTGWRGYPYDWTLRDLVADPNMSPREVAVMFVEETQALLSVPPYSGEEVNCHAAIDLSKVGPLGDAVIKVGTLLAQDMKTNAGIVSKARGGANFAYGANAINVVDLKAFIELVSENTADKAIRAACAQAIECFDDTVIALQTTNALEGQINGLGVIFPNHSWETPSYYPAYAFPQAGWMDFLGAYWRAAGSV